MIDLDQQIRDGLVDASADIGASRPADLASRLVAIRTRRRRTTRRRALALAAAVVLIAGITAAVAESRHGDQAQVITGPGEPKGFADLGPGWHVLDTGPVPGDEPRRAGLDRSRAPRGRRGSHVRVRPEHRCVAMSSPPPPFELDGVVWIGDALVATGQSSTERRHQPASSVVGSDRATSGTTSGRSRSPPAWSPPAAAARPPNDYGDSLVWTGQRVIDSTHGAVLDPGSWRWSDLAMPDNVIAVLRTAGDQSRLGWSRARHQHLRHAGRFGLERPRHVLPRGARGARRSHRRGRGEPQHVGRSRRGERRARARDRHGPRRRARSDHRDLDRPSSPSPECRRAKAALRSSPRSARTCSSPPATGPIRSSCVADTWQTTGPQPDVPAAKNGFAWHRSVAGGRRCGDRVVDEHGRRQRRRGRPTCMPRSGCRPPDDQRSLPPDDTTLVSSGPWR